ncbi:hypothetical protein BDZ45DRAFT_485460 [Acephala macrosclerotiorum]|nr:hypothetical protein BDZ45DRAFT_485460 [Acephala macrosclerotiorum]
MQTVICTNLSWVTSHEVQESGQEGFVGSSGSERRSVHGTLAAVLGEKYHLIKLLHHARWSPLLMTKGLCIYSRKRPKTLKSPRGRASSPGLAPSSTFERATDRWDLFLLFFLVFSRLLVEVKYGRRHRDLTIQGRAGGVERNSAWRYGLSSVIVSLLRLRVVQATIKKGWILLFGLVASLRALKRPHSLMASQIFKSASSTFLKLPPTSSQQELKVPLAL